MSFKLNEEQVGLQDALRKCFTETISSKYLRSRYDGTEDADPELWKTLDELGLMEAFAEPAGADAVGTRELAVIAAECGRALLPENLTLNILCGPLLLCRLNAELAKKSLGAEAFTAIAAGSRLVTCAPVVTDGFEIRDDKSGVTASGELRFVPAALVAQHVLFSYAGELYLTVDSAAFGPDCLVADPALDGTIKRFKVTLNKAKCVNVPSAADFHAHVAVLSAAELHGVGERVVDMTREYVSTREQFGVPVGGFQAVQHKLVDMYVGCEALDALTRFASWSESGSPDQFEFAAKAALRYATSRVPSVCERAIQLFGGIGFTWEFDLHFFLRRARTIKALFGSNEEDRNAFLTLAAEMSNSTE